MSTVPVAAIGSDHAGSYARRRELHLESMRALARRVNARRQECARERSERVPISPAMSRILEHDSDYVPYRPRKAHPGRRYVQNIGVFSLQRIAAELQTTVGELLGEKPALLTLGQRRDLRRCVVFLIRMFDLNAPEVRGRDAAAAP